MRVIGGTFRGRALESPRGLATRPITDRVKETLFNILGHRLATPGGLPAVDVLDVFAGTGGLGIEALSRGARSCVFVERDRRALRSLRENLRCLELERIGTLLADNAWTMRPPRVPGGFGLVFVDPPYRDAADPLRVLDLLERLSPSVAAQGLVVFRHESSAALTWHELRSLRPADERAFRRMRLVFLVHSAGESLPPEDSGPPGAGTLPGTS